MSERKTKKNNVMYHCIKKKIPRDEATYRSTGSILENYKTVSKEVEDNTNIRTYDISIPYSWIGRINIVQMTILLKAICRFSAIPSRILIAFFTKLEQVINKFVWKHRRPLIAKTILRKNNEAGGITLPDFRL